MTSSLAAQIAKGVARARGPEEGAVVTFERHVKGSFERATEDQVLTYAAVFVEGQWWFTGKTLSPRRHPAMLELLAGQDVRNVRVATAFEAVT